MVGATSSEDSSSVVFFNFLHTDSKLAVIQFDAIELGDIDFNEETDLKLTT